MILNHFQGTPRPHQKSVLEQIEKSWNDYDVFVIEAPVAFGKSKTAHCIAAWAGKELHKSTTIITPTNMLVKQYEQEFANDMRVIKKKADYSCHGNGKRENRSCEDNYKKEKLHCSNCPFIQAKAKLRTAGINLHNYYSYLASKAYTPILIADEAHNLLPMLRETFSKKYWQKDYKYPGWVTTYATLDKWLTQVLATPGLEPKHRRKLEKLKEELYAGKLRYIVSRSLELFRGKEEDCLKLIPLDVTGEPPLLWPSRIKKLVLLSATISRVEVELLGLAGKKVKYIRSGSPIPASNRPIECVNIGNFSYHHMEESLPKLAEFLLACVDGNTKGKGLVHITYSMASKLKELLGDNPRFLFHDQLTKTRVYDYWRRSDPEKGLILMGAGMAEGLDLAGKDYLWQVIAKVPYPSLGEPSIKYTAEKHPERYVWDTLKTIIQQSGRICRSPDDYGITLIADSTFKRLLQDGLKYDLVPQWFMEAFVNE